MTQQLRLVLLAVLFSSLITAVFAVFPGDYLMFDDGDYVTGSGIPTTLTAVTLEGWVNHSDLNGSYQRYLTIGSENAVIRFNGGTQLHFYIKNSSGTLKALTADVLTTEEWLHVAGTYDGTTMKLYLNGVVVASQTPSPAGFYTCDGTFGISRSGESMHGKLDDFRFWTVARTQAQIQQNRFLQLTGSETGLRSYWRMDSSSGTTVIDDKGYSNGTMYNMNDFNWMTDYPVPTVSSNTAGKALSFDGTDDYVSLQQRSGLPIYTNGTDNAYTVSMWVKGEGQDKYIYAESTTNRTDWSQFYLLARPNGKLMVYILTYNNSLNLMATSSTVAFDNTWHHIAWVDNNGTATLYIDGVADGTNFNYTRAGTFNLNTSAIGV